MVKGSEVPTFGYDANSDAVAAIADGYAGCSQHPDVGAYLTPSAPQRDSVEHQHRHWSADDAGNKIDSQDYKYVAERRSYYALNLYGAEGYKDRP